MKGRRVTFDSVLAGIAIALSTLICFRMRLSLAAPLCLDLLVVVLLSLRGSFLASAIISIVAVWCLDYYFAPPLFSLLIFDPIDIFAVSLFIATAAVITTLVSRLRIHTKQLSATNATLEEQIAEVKNAQDQLSLARTNRVMLLGELTASIAHEVNQPLTAIVANGGTALRYLDRSVPDLQQVRRYLGQMVKDGRRAAEVIVRVRALTRNAPPRATTLDVNETILEVIALVSRDLQSKRVDLRTELGTDLPHIAADRIQLQQVLLNLIVNALDALDEVGDGPHEVLVASRASASSEVLVEVRDSGPGFDLAHGDRLFTAFFTTKNGGMGLGLSISRTIVEAHGGRLWALPNEPRGSVFQFTMPADARPRGIESPGTYA